VWLKVAVKSPPRTKSTPGWWAWAAWRASCSWPWCPPAVLRAAAGHEVAPAPLGTAAHSDTRSTTAAQALSHVAAHRQKQTVNPELDPQSDEHFFKHDYPDDMRPSTGSKKFDHPYPVVQEHDEYDKDFVKDENSDNGEWKAQFDYDRLRSQLKSRQDEVRDAYRRSEEEKQKLEDLESKQQVAEEASQKAKAEAEEARREAEEAHKKLEDLEGKAAANAGEEGKEGKEGEEGEAGKDGKLGGAIGDAVGDVKDKMKGLEECQKELEEAKAKLQNLMKEKERRDKAMEEAKAAAQAKVEAANAKAKEDYDAAVAKSTAKILGTKSDAEGAEQALQDQEKDLEKQIKEAEAAHRAALRAYNEEKEQMEKAESGLSAAADKLRKYRGGVDQDGGVVPERSRSRLTAHAQLVGTVLMLTLAASV